MKHTYDFEFLEQGYGPIHPLSLGICAEDGREFYAVFGDAPWHQVAEHDWLMENVVRPHLPITFQDAPRGAVDRSHPDQATVQSHYHIAEQVLEFLTVDLAEGQKAELWADYPATDHVCLYQLWGPMVQVPEGIPWSTFCLHQEEVRRRGEWLVGLFVPRLPKQDPNTEHHALHDARHNMAVARAMGVIE